VRDVLLRFVRLLRRRGMSVSPAETMDALAAVAAAGVEREVLREALATTLVKDEHDRPLFDACFEIVFPLVRGDESRGARRKRGQPGQTSSSQGEPGPSRQGRRGEHSGSGPGASSPPGPGEPPEPREGQERAQRSLGASAPRWSEAVRDLRRAVPQATALEQGGAATQVTSARARKAALLGMPFAGMTASDVAEARDVAAALGARLRGRLARRERLARRGRLDLRRTLRAATGTGGVPLRLRRRARCPGRPDLVALCDLSGSVAAASELLLCLLAAAHDWFRRATTFAFVDRLCPVSVEHGHVVPAGSLDLHARSDFGRVLADFWPAFAGVLGSRTLLLVLGDARNNRRPPRRDLWQAIRARTGRIVWLVPEPRPRWNTGDSVLGLYAPACDAVVECLDLAALASAVRRAL